jgi:hypothetical protein
MPKQGARRTAKASNGSAASRPSVSSSNPEETLWAPTLSHEDVAARAYASFLARGGQPGDDLRDWFQAEAELCRERKAIRTPSPE